MGQKRCFWIPGMGVFVMDNAKKRCLASGVAPQTPIPLYRIDQQRCFWIPRMGVFELRSAKKKIVMPLGWRPKHPYLHTPWAQQDFFGYLGWWCLKWTMPKNVVWVLGWPPKHPYRCTQYARKGIFRYLRWGCLNCTTLKKLFGFLGGAPNTHTSAIHGPEKVFLNT